MNDHDEGKAEIGVLLVHGIGEQQRGETLLNLGEPMVEWIERWLDRVGMAWTGDFGQEVPEPYRRYRYGGRVRITQANVLPDAAETPPHVRFLMETGHSPDRAPRSEWLIAESRWAASFPPPNPRDVIQWTMKILPMIIASAIASYRVFRVWWTRRRGSGKRSWARRAAGQVSFFAALAVMAFVTSPIVLALDVLLIGLLLLTFIPIPAIQRYLDWVQFKLAAIIGDSYIFTESEMRKRAVVDRLLADLEWLEHRCQSITIVAHSQGAAVAYYALQERVLSQASSTLAGRIRLIVTFGSGLAKLEALTENRRSRRDFTDSPYQIVAFIGVPLAAITVLLLSFGGISPRYGGIVALAIAAVILLLMGLMTLSDTSRGPERLFEEWGRRLGELDIHWIDVYASSDPVPGGPLVRAEAPEAESREPREPTGPESHQVHNRGSLFSDHTTYQSNANEFIPLLVTSIAKHCACSLPLHDLTPKDTAAMAAAATLRRYRVRFLQTRRWVILLSMISLFVNPAALSLLGTTLTTILTGLRRLPVVESIVPSGPGAISLGISHEAAGFLVALLLFSLLRSFLTWTWTLVDASAVTDLTWRKTHEDVYVGRPFMLPNTRKGEVRFVDYLLRLTPWLAVSIAIAIHLPGLSASTAAWLPASPFAPLRLVLLLTLSLALLDLFVSYWRRRSFLMQFIESPAQPEAGVTPS
jgi:hypothetical protein